MTALLAIALKALALAASGFLIGAGLGLVLGQPLRTRPPQNPFLAPAPDRGADRMAGVALAILGMLALAALATGGGA